MSTPTAEQAPGEVLVVDADQPRAPGPRPVLDVAVGVLIDRDGRFLLTTRPPGKAYAGHWEFPGGKVEPGETVEQALRRELQEEIGVIIGAAQPWRVLRADYPHAHVRLHVCRVFDWCGGLQMHEGQAYAWQTLPVTVAPVLPGTWPLLRWMEQEGAAPRSSRQRPDPLTGTGSEESTTDRTPSPPVPPAIAGR